MLEKGGKRRVGGKGRKDELCSQSVSPLWTYLLGSCIALRKLKPKLPVYGLGLSGRLWVNPGICEQRLAWEVSQDPAKAINTESSACGSLRASGQDVPAGLAGY